MQKSIQTIIVLVILVIVGFSIYQSKKPLPPKNNVIVAFGDSLVEGHGATPGHDFVSLVSQKIGMPIINEGISGDTTWQALQRINNVLAHDPGVVIILLGGNDYLRRVPKEETFTYLHSIVSILKEKDVRVLLLGVRGGLLRDTYEGDFKNFARREKIPYISNVLENILGNTDLMYDSVHPNDKGYEIIANRVTPKLKEILGK